MEYLPTTANFLAIEDERYFNYRDAGFAIFAAPYEYTSSYHRGSAEGPAAILRASHFVEMYDEELDAEPYLRSGIATLPAIHFGDAIDAAAVDLVAQKAGKILDDNKTPIMLGAEHTVTLGAVTAAAQRFSNLSVLQIDAHSDLRQQYQGNRYSHASVMARVHELGVPIVQIGIRAQCKQEAELIQQSGNIHTWYAHQIHAAENRSWVDQAVSQLTPHVYVTIDADGFDPSVIPAVGTAEPNGLNWGQVTRLLAAVSQHKRVVGFDVVEVAPVAASTVSEYTLAKLIYKFIGYLTQHRND